MFIGCFGELFAGEPNSCELSRVLSCNVVWKCLMCGLQWANGEGEEGGLRLI